MNKARSYGYLIIGVLLGFALGVSSLSESTVTYEKLGYFLGALVLAFFYQWFEEGSHARHLAKWTIHRQQGALYFITAYYVLARAISILVIFSLPLWLKLNPTPDVLLITILTGIITLFAFAFLGHQEWGRCQEDFDIQTLRDLAKQPINPTSVMHGGGV